MVVDIIFYTLGIVGLLEGAIIYFFPNKSKKIIIQSFSNEKKAKKLGAIESIFSLILILIGFLIN